MSPHDFIFSNKRSIRLARHASFWLGWFLFSGLVQMSFNTVNDKDPLVRLMGTIFFQFIRSFVRFPSIFLFCYFVVYFLAPRFMRRGRLWKFTSLLLLSLVPLYLLTYAWMYFCVEIVHINPYIQHWQPWIYIFNSFYSNVNFTGALSTCALMLAIKYYKDWSLKQRRSAHLTRENIQAELQLLKAQVHPHFLFNTLNNIYSFVLKKDPRAAGLVDKLGGMIDYMRTEGEKPLVPLEKEIRLIEHYIGLERVRYGDRLEFTADITYSEEDTMIAPLLMIPFVENSFKHGTSQMLSRPWIKLEITCVRNQLFFKLSNSKPGVEPTRKQNKGIGLNNVKKRLQLLYPGKHQLEIFSTDDSFTVNMQILFENESAPAAQEVQQHQTIAYA